MDDRLLKRSVQSIEMPADMKDRIITNCRSGEAKPLILPKRRFAYMPIAAAACVCVTVAAVAGVGVWQLGGMNDGGSDISMLPEESEAGVAVIDDVGDAVDMAQIREKLTLDKLLEICSGDCSKLSWKDFEQFESKDIGSGLYILHYDIDGKYTLNIGGVPEEDPWYMRFHVLDQYYDIDIREKSIEEYLKQPIPTGDVINVIQLGPEPVTSDDFIRPESDFVEMTQEELNEYFGMDVFPETPDDFYWWYEPSVTGAIGVCKSDNGTGEVYLDYNSLTYSGDYTDVWERGLSVYFMKGRIPHQQKELLWGDPEKLSVINGVTVAIGVDDDERYYAEFMIGSENVGFHIQGGIRGGLTLDEWIDIVRSYLGQSAQTSQQTAPSQSGTLTLGALKALINEKGKDLTWSDFSQFDCAESHTNFYVRRYDIEGLYYLLIGGDLNKKPEYMYFSVIGTGQSGRIDIREQDIDSYIKLFWDRIKEIQAGEDQKQSAYEYLYSCEQKYYGISNDLNTALQRYSAAGMERIELEMERDSAISEYNATGWDTSLEQIRIIEKALTQKDTEMNSLMDTILKLQLELETANAELLDAKQAFVLSTCRTEVPDGPAEETVQTAPLMAAPATNYWASVAGMTDPITDYYISTNDFVKLSTKELNEYYGINVIPQLPDYMALRNDKGSLGVYRRDGGTGEVYIDINAYGYASNEHFRIYDNGGYHPQTMTIEVMKGGIPESSADIWQYTDLLSNINGVTVAIGKQSDRSFVAEFFVEDVGFHITADYITLDQLTEVISSLTAQ